MKTVTTGGGIATKKTKDGMYIALVKKEGSLVIPKGHINDGESIEECAVREVWEETGLYVYGIIKKLGIIQRLSKEDNGELVNKDIHVFLMKNSIFQDEEPQEEYDWFKIKEAIPKMKFKEEANFLETLEIL